MIKIKAVKQYCCEDPSLIENYYEAINSEESWHCHHRLGIILHKKKKELIELGLYYNRPASELIFLTNSEHQKLHHIKDNTFLLEHLSEEHKEKISKTLKELFNSEYYHNIFTKNNKGENNPMYGHIWTKEQLEHCRQGALNRDNANVGKYKRTSEINEKISKAMTGKMSGEKNPMYGKRGKDSPSYGLHWYNNGNISIKARECPEGFKPGRIYIRKDK